MSLSIYGTGYNLQKMGFSWKETLQNWLDFLHHSGEIVIAVNTSEDDTVNLIRQYVASTLQSHSQISVKVIDAEIPYTDPEFDGKLKALALSHCTQPYAMLLDFDELLVPSQRALWVGLARDMEMDYSFDSYLVPVVDIFGDEQHYKGIGTKFYIHRNTSNITRGVHKQAYREDGSIDKTKSDTTEAIYKDSREIIRAKQLVMMDLPQYITVGCLESGVTPFVVHLGWLNLEQRVKQSAFWRPHWDNRDKHSQEPETTLVDLEKIPRYHHNLPPWK